MSFKVRATIDIIVKSIDEDRLWNTSIYPPEPIADAEDAVADIVYDVISKANYCNEEIEIVDFDVTKIDKVY